MSQEIETAIARKEMIQDALEIADMGTVNAIWDAIGDLVFSVLEDLETEDGYYEQPTSEPPKPQ